MATTLHKATKIELQ